MMLQHDTPDDFVLATGECHPVRPSYTLFYISYTTVPLFPHH